jgi:Gnt-I system high-affinity gluconate transporter
MLLLLSILFLVFLILVLRLHASLALLCTALATGLVSGLSPTLLFDYLQKGLGSTLGSVAPVLALGVMLGSILSETGAAQVIALRLLHLLGHDNAGLALALSAFVVGVTMFYNAGFVIVAPLAFSVAAMTQKPLLPLAIAMAAPLSVTHGFLPPHPSATAVTLIFGADPGKTLLLGLVVAIPVIALSGLVFPRFLKGIKTNPPKEFFTLKHVENPPSTLKSVFVALLPVLLMATYTIAELTLPKDATLRLCLRFLGDPSIALLLTVKAALLLLSNPSLRRATLLARTRPALEAAVPLLLVLAAGSFFKEVLIGAALADEAVKTMAAWQLPPYISAWGVATLLRIALGSATVAGITAAGIVLPLTASQGASPELMVLAVGAGSLMCSHVNDTGFWMFREWFGLSLRDTFLSWTLMETIVGVSGLLAVLAVAGVMG